MNLLDDILMSLFLLFTLNFFFQWIEILVRISYCRMLLHDTMLQQDSFRSGTSVWNRGTVEHVEQCQFNTFCCDVRIILEYEMNCLITLKTLG